jgi:tRNA-splicing ligase RtcB (3'-phosphate/5'-hydroxy nucleic acid ligase)
MTYELIASKGKPIYAWVKGVPVEPHAADQLRNIAALPIVHDHIAVMPDVHVGKGATVGSVIPTVGAIIPAAVGVDIGCGMAAVRTSLRADQLPDSLLELRLAIEEAVPHGGPGVKGSWAERGRRRPSAISEMFSNRYPKGASLADGLKTIVAKHDKLGSDTKTALSQLGTLGGGNHFVEVCLDTDGKVWIMLHSGSRGAGNRIGQYFIERAKAQIAKAEIRLVDRDLAWLAEGTPEFDDYVAALGWAQDYAATNRKAMLANVIAAMRKLLPPFELTEEAVNCHHNYVAREHHAGADVWVTRKGAVSARDGQLGIIPGSMGAKSFVVRGKGNAEAFHSCSHGAGRKLSRGAAKAAFTLDDHIAATAGVECRKDAGVIDETPGAYKDIDDVMAAQSDLVDVVATLKQVLCVKG